MPTETEEELPPPSPDPSISEEWTFHSQYKVLKTIGKGSHAKVLLAHRRLTGTRVAVKVPRKDKQWFWPAMTEANIMRKINHPNIVSLLQVIENKTRIYLIMELVEGQQLYQYIRESGRRGGWGPANIWTDIVSSELLPWKGDCSPWPETGQYNDW